MKKIAIISIIMVFSFNMSLLANPILKFFGKKASKQVTKQSAKSLGKEAAEKSIKVGLKQGTKVIAKNADSIAIPLLKRTALETAEHNITNPKIAQKLIVSLGDDLALKTLNKVPQSEIPMFVRYVEAADSPATRNLFIEYYKKEGSDIFKRVTPKMVMATGLSAAMLYGTYRTTSPLVATAEVIEKNPHVANNYINKSSEGLKSVFISLFSKPIMFVTIVLCIIILSKFGIFEQFFKYINQNLSKQSNCSNVKA